MRWHAIPDADLGRRRAADDLRRQPGAAARSLPGEVRRSLSERAGNRVRFYGAYQNGEMPSLMQLRRLADHSLDLVGELADRDPGSLLPRPPDHLQQYRRHGGEDHRRRRRPAFPRRQPRKTCRSHDRRPARIPSSGTACGPASSARSTLEECARQHLDLYRRSCGSDRPKPADTRRRAVTA